MSAVDDVVNNLLPIDLIPVSIALLNNSGTLVMVNDQCANVLGYPKEELASISLFNF